MKKLIRLLGSSLIIVLVVTSCNIIATPTESLEVAIQATPTLAKLELATQVDTSIQYTSVGQNIRFVYGIKNTGGVGIAGTVIMTGAVATCPALTTVGNLNDSLDPNETVICTTDYPITQADLDKGSVAIVVTAAINGIVSNQATATVAVGTPKVLTVTVAANPTAYSQANQDIIFTYTLKNSGTTILGPDQFNVRDSLLGSIPIACGAPNTSLSPEQTLTCTATYKTTQADMGLASITNVVSASGGGASSSQPAGTTVNKGTVTNPTNLTAGSTISHTVINGEWIWQIARCYGADPNKIVEANTQLADPSQIKKDMVLTVPNIGSNGKIYGPPCVVPHTVASGETWASIAQLYNADPVIMQMLKVNSLTVGSVVIVPKNSAGTTTPSNSIKALSVSVSTNPTTYEQAGQQITFTYVIKNSGNTNLGPDQFKISDTLIGATPLNCGAPNTSLTPNATVTCTFVYSITQPDLNIASVTSRAIASGGGANPSTEASTTVNKAVKSLTLTVTANSPTYNQAGQQIIFTYVIKNSGTVSLGPSQFTITDLLIGATAFNCGNADASLAPNATVTCTATYLISQADMNLASITSRATAAGGGAPTSPEANITINKQ